ncbi:acyl transferase domain-containing protein [Catenulispora sp. EB89]|uniref:beta-ketoacyl synthase N-terminal-like domain-containing protein n=1 Tax=Catenulispora sp. EB89 TaxID=3156257 RepID=UPI0035195334
MATEDKLREYLKRATVDLADARRRLAEADARRREPIAIVGMSCRFPGAPSVPEYWRLLSEGRSGVLDGVPDGRFALGPEADALGVYTRRGGFVEDVTRWDARFFGFPPREALRMDPQQRLLMELAWEGMEDAGAPAASLAGTRTAVIVGFSDVFQYGRIEDERVGPEVFTDPYTGQGSSPSVVAGRLAYHFDLRGPTLALDTACSSSLVAVHLASEALRRGECDTALAGGVFLALHPDMYVHGCATSMLSRSGQCRTFDAAADGYVLGEGGGLVLLERLSDALRNGRRIHAVIRGSAVNQDGRSNGLTAPNRGAQVDVIRRALAAAQADPADLSYVEAHGSGTPLGDEIELAALGEVFAGRTTPLPVGAVKTNIGHTQAAAGMAGLIKTVLVLEHGRAPANLNLAEPAEAVLASTAVQPCTAARDLPTGERPLVAGVSSFGWSGTNAHAVLEAAPAVETTGAAAAEAEVLRAVGAEGAQAVEVGAEVLRAARAEAARTVEVDALWAAGAEVLRPVGAEAARAVGAEGAQAVEVEADALRAAELEAASAAEAEASQGAKTPRPELLMVSAAGQEALSASLQRLADAVASTGASLAEVAYTLRTGRSELDVRRAIVATSLEDAAVQLAAAGEAPGVRRLKDRPRVGFVSPDMQAELVERLAGLGIVPDLIARDESELADVDAVIEFAADIADPETWLLQTCGRLWELGLGLNRSVRGASGLRPISLPTYPFQRERYWVDVPGESATDRVELLTQRWEAVESPSEVAYSGRYVLYRDASGVADALADLLRARGAEVEFATAEPAAADTPTTVVHLAALDTSHDEADEAEAVASAASAIAAWGEASAPARVLVVTRAAHAVRPADAMSSTQAAVAVLPIVANQEYPHLDCRSIDLDPTHTASVAAETIAAELRQPSDAPQRITTAYRAGRRYAPTYSAAAAPLPPLPVVRPGGTYLITGGLGEIGLVIAEHLVRQGAAELLLTSRSGEPADPHDPRAVALRRLRELGATVATPRVDVTDPAAMRELFASAGRRIDGVVHAAADARQDAFQPLRDLDRTSAARHFGAKVDGARVLVGVVAELAGQAEPAESADPNQNRSPDWCMLFSSTSALLGGVTFGAYAAANAALGAVAQAANAHGSTRWTSAVWDTWACTLGKLSGGIGASLVAHSMTDVEALDAFDRAIGHGTSGTSGTSPIVIAAGGLADRLPRPASRAASAATATARAGTAIRHPRPDLPQPYAPPRTATERAVAAVWSAELGVEPVGMGDNFFDLGGTSLVVPGLLAAIAERCGVSLPTVALFEAPTVRSLAAIVDERGARRSEPMQNTEPETQNAEPETQSTKQEPAPQTPPTPVSTAASQPQPPRPLPVLDRERPAPLRTPPPTPTEADRHVAIIGMAGRFPGAADVDTFWSNLCAGVESISFFTRDDLIAAGVAPDLVDDPSYVLARPVLDDIAGFDAAFFGISPRQAAITDPQQRLFLEVCWEALEQAGYARADDSRGKVGVFGGTHLSTYLHGIQDQLEADGVSIFELAMGNEKDALTTVVSYLLDLHGPSVAVQTFCSTSLVAAHLAVQSLRAGDCDMALAGGVSIRVPDKSGHLYVPGGMESPDGHVRTFDAQARGSMFGDGAAVVALKRLSDALRDGDHVWGVIRGSAMNNDGTLKVGYTAPSVVGQSRVVVAAMADAGVTPEDVGYVEAHGTGTVMGDPIEVAALTRAYGPTPRKQYCAIGSLKTNVGHLDRAAGAAGLIKTAMVVREQVIPPTLHYSSPNPGIDFADSPFYVAAELQPWPLDSAGPGAADSGPRIAGLNSLGMGGTNVHMIVEEPPQRRALGTRHQDADPAASRRVQILPVSARTADAADAACRRLGEHLDANPNTRLVDAAYTLQAGRRTFEHRRVAVVSGLDDAVTALTDPGAARPPMRRTDPAQQRPVAFLLAGVGEQYPGMVGELYRREPVFREQLDECLALVGKALTAHGPFGGGLPGVGMSNADLPDTDLPDLLDLLTGARGGGGGDLAALLGRRGAADPRTEALERTEIIQPLMFAVDYALAVTLMRWGVHPTAMLGYSLGEYVAACLAGVLSLEDAIALVAYRAALIGAAEHGSMAAVPLSADELRDRFALDELGLDVAAVNGPGTTVVAGPAAALDMLTARLRERDIPARPLQTTHAFHSRMLAPLADDLTAWVAANVTLNAPELPYLSNVTGGPAEAELVCDPGYWARHMCATVQFADAAAELLADPDLAVVEIGPGKSLGTLMRAAGCPPERWPLICATLPAAGDPTAADETLSEGVARLWLAGVEIDWDAYHGRVVREGTVLSADAPGRVPLPTYPFQRKRHWIEPTGTVRSHRAGAGIAAPAVTSAAASAAPYEATRLEDLDLLPKLPEEQWLSVPVWRQIPAAPPAAAQPGSWLVFARDGLAAQVLDELRAAAAASGAAVTEVRPGVGYGDGYAAGADGGYTVRPGSSEDILAMLQDLRRREIGLERVVHLWALDERSELDDKTALALGLHSLAALCRAAGEAGSTHWALDIVSAGAFPVLDGSEARPVAAALVGPALVIPLEYPSISTRLIDAEPATDAAAIVAELRRERTGTPVALRGTRRWLSGFETVAPADLDEAAKTLRPGGVYLITGGLGGLGLAMAERLVRACGAKLVLLGRSGLPPREQWAAIASGALAADPAVRDRVERVRALIALGGEVEIAVGDVADSADVRRAVGLAQERFGALHGVLHAAGVPGVGLIQFKGSGDSDAVLAPKVDGVRALAEALRLDEPDEVPLDFLLLFSSIVTSTGGGPGQFDYCAANSYLDGYAAKLAAAGHRVVSVGWGEWAWNAWEGGLGGVDDGTAAFMRRHRDAFGLTFDEGWRMLLRALAAGEPRVVVSTQDLPTMVRYGRSFTVDLFWAATPAEGAGQARHPRPELVTAYQEPSTEAERTIAEIWGAALKLDRIGALDNFFELGGSSLLGINLLAAVQRAFPGAHLPPHILHEAPTVAALARIAAGLVEDTPPERGGEVRELAELRRSGLKAAAARRRRG